MKFTFHNIFFLFKMKFCIYAFQCNGNLFLSMLFISLFIFGWKVDNEHFKAEKAVKAIRWKLFMRLSPNNNTLPRRSKRCVDFFYALDKVICLGKCKRMDKKRSQRGAREQTRTQFFFHFFASVISIQRAFTKSFAIFIVCTALCGNCASAACCTKSRHSIPGAQMNPTEWDAKTHAEFNFVYTLILVRSRFPRPLLPLLFVSMEICIIVALTYAE